MILTWKITHSGVREEKCCHVWKWNPSDPPTTVHNILSILSHNFIISFSMDSCVLCTQFTFIFHCLWTIFMHLKFIFTMHPSIISYIHTTPYFTRVLSIPHYITSPWFHDNNTILEWKMLFCQGVKSEWIITHNVHYSLCFTL